MALNGINIQLVNNVKEYRQDFLESINSISDIIFDVKQKLNDSEYKELYEILSHLETFKTKIKTTIIYQVIERKHELNRNIKRVTRRAR